MGIRALLECRPTLKAWVDEYSAIEAEYVEHLRSFGVDFAPWKRSEQAAAQVKGRLRAKGATFRHGGASIVTGALSDACVACTMGAGSETFVLSLRCNRNCYFCFNHNQDASESDCAFNADWRKDVDAFADAVGQITHVGLSGGEPLLHKQDAVAFVQHVKSINPDAHVRLYTAGDFLDEDILASLRDAGLKELRMSVKLDVEDAHQADAIIDAALEKLSLANRFIDDVLVEMPVIPGTQKEMQHLLSCLDDLGIFGINLLEFGYPLNSWDAFRQRGLQVKNPPFSIPYNYTYPGGLPIEGSELLCLQLLEYALDKGLSLGVHYCSLENKNRGQVYRQNAEVTLDESIYQPDEEDFFYKTVKFFDGDAEFLRGWLGKQGIAFVEDETDGSIAVHPCNVGMFKELSVVPALSYNVVERSAQGLAIREVKLEVLGGTSNMDQQLKWQARAAAWELLALSLRYPEGVLSEVVSTGEWMEAAAELADALDADLPAGFEQSLATYEDTDAEELLHALRTEATHLFVGAGLPVVNPYEGVFRAQQKGLLGLMYVNDTSVAVERFMKACGLGHPQGTNDPIDHVATECELLQYLASIEAGLVEDAEVNAAVELPGGSAQAAYVRFMDEHVDAWMVAFADAVMKESREPFYGTVALLLKQLLGAGLR